MVQVDFALYGLAASWRFPGSPGLGQWLDTLPWLAEGGLCSVTCTATSDYSVISSAIERRVFAAQAGHSDLRIIQVESGADLDSPLAACLAPFEIDSSGARLRIADALARALDSAPPTLFLLRVIGENRPEESESLSDFADIYRKRHPGTPLTIIVLGTNSVPSIRPRFDFWQGWPEGIDLWGEGLGLLNRWAGYRYLRIAWEAAGSLSIAEDLEQRTRNLQLGDDESLEKHFNDHARKRFSTVNLTASVWTRLISTYGYRHPRPQPEEVAGQPALWWTPPHSIGLRLVPWVCRAALLERRESGFIHWKLRNELICEPLARDLFALCQQGEALIRARAFRSGFTQSPSDDACKLLKSFQEDKNDNPSYPFSHPAPPNDAWVFASLGEVIKSASERFPDPFWDLLLLRNSVVHGHFVGWKQVTTLINFMRVVQ